MMFSCDVLYKITCFYSVSFRTAADCGCVNRFWEKICKFFFGGKKERKKEIHFSTKFHFIIIYTHSLHAGRCPLPASGWQWIVHCISDIFRCRLLMLSMSVWRQSSTEHPQFFWFQWGLSCPHSSMWILADALGMCTGQCRLLCLLGPQEILGM